MRFEEEPSSKQARFERTIAAEHGAAANAMNRSRASVLNESTSHKHDDDDKDVHNCKVSERRNLMT